MPNYGDPSYWNKRYSEQGSKMFDWLEDFESLRPIIEKIAPTKKEKILMLGCGNAEISEKMYQNGYENIHNIDISSVVIDLMKKRCADMKNMTWEVMDATDMTYKDNTFDVVIDKSTIDALLCGDDSFLNVARMTKEIQRILKVDGYYFIISYGTPENRLLHLKRPHLSWRIESFVIERDFPENPNASAAHYCYISQKNSDADEVSKKKWERVEMQLILEEEKEKLLEAERIANGEKRFSDSEEGSNYGEYEEEVEQDPTDQGLSDLIQERVEKKIEELAVVEKPELQDEALVEKSKKEKL